MSKHYHSANSGQRMLTHGRKEGMGPFINLRHPKRVELLKKAAAAVTERDENTVVVRYVSPELLGGVNTDA